MIINPETFISGGGLPEVITGEFTTGSGTGSMDIDTGYTGDGYLLAFYAYIDDADHYEDVGIGMDSIIAIKTQPFIEPTYDGTGEEDGLGNVFVTRNNTTSVSQYGGKRYAYDDSDVATFGSNTIPVHVRNRRFINVGWNGEQYGLSTNQKYKYYAVYMEGLE